MRSDHRWQVSVHVLGLRLEFTLRPRTRARRFGRPQVATVG